MKIRTVHRYYHWLFLAGGVLAIVGLVVWGAVFVRAEPESTTKDILWKVGAGFTTSPSQLFWGKIDAQGSRDPDGDLSPGGSGGKHVVRDSNNGKNKEVNLSLYYPALPSDGYGSIKIGALMCNFSVAGRVRVYVSDQTTDPTVRKYNRGVGAVCEGANQLKDQEFYPRLHYDSNTEMYKGSIKISLEESLSTDSSQSMRFSATSTGYLTYRYQFGDDGTAFGINTGGKWRNGTKVVVPFGLPCKVENAAGLPNSIKIYDPEAGTENKSQFGPSYVKVFYKDREGNEGALSKADLTPVRNVDIKNNGRVDLVGGNGATSEVKVNNMQPGYRYAMVFYNPEDGVHVESDTPGVYRGESTSNTISFSVPTDSIGGLINCNYNLTPHIDINTDHFDTEANLGPKASVTEGNGAVAGGIDHEWQVVKVEFTGRPDFNTSSVDNGDTPCSYLRSLKGSADIVGSCDTQQITPGYPRTSTWSSSGATGEVDIGHWVCYMTSVYKPTWQSQQSDSNLWRHSASVCAVSGISPKVQIWGGDLKTTKDVTTSTSFIRNKTYGSWGEYGVMADGVITNMASGAGFNGGSGPADTLADRNQLTFANNTPSYGGFGVTIQSPTLWKDTEGVPKNYFESARAYGKDANKVYNFIGQGPITIGKNITYKDDEPYAKISQIPRVVILADSFVIDNDVTQIDPWLIATNSQGGSGAIYTCADGIDLIPVPTQKRLSTDICNKPLTFNGPVYADKIYLHRTHGSRNSDPGEPAEVFNLRADAYLSAIAGNSDIPVATTDSVIELPPRF